MAVAHSAASESHTGANGSVSQAAFSWTHTQTGTPQGVVVFVCTFASTAGLATSASYGGVALTKVQAVATDLAGELGRVDVFFRGSGLGTGNQTITVNRTNNATVMYAAAATVTAGADTVIPAQFAVLLQNDGTLTAQSVTDTSVGVDSLRYAGAYSGLNTPPTAATGSTLLNSIDIGNYGFAMVREDTAGQGARSVGFIGATDDRAAIHLAIRELVPRSLPQTVASFTLTGNAADLVKAAAPKVMDGGTGTFTMTGQSADLRHNPNTEAGTGAFLLDGQPADTRHNVRIEGGTGAFTFTGNPATPAKTSNKAITADPGQFTLTGSDATLKHGVAITAEAGAFALAGNGATLVKARVLPAGLGEFTVGGRTWGTGGWDSTTWGAVGESATLLYGRCQSSEAGVFTLLGQPAGLAQTQSLPAVNGVFALDNQPATLRQQYRLTAETGTFTVAGQAVTLRHNPRIEAATGSFALTGGAPALLRGRYLSGGAGEFIETGQPVTLRRTWAIQGGTGLFAIVGNSAALVKENAYEITPVVGGFTFTGNAASLVDTDELGAVVGLFSLTGNDATLAKTTTARRRVVFIF